VFDELSFDFDFLFCEIFFLPGLFNLEDAFLEVLAERGRDVIDDFHE
jgi:hypothetical protein